MIWATVSSWSYFCWRYRASPSLAAKNIIHLISVLTIWWCPSGLYVSENWEFVGSALWQKCSLNCYQSASPKASLCFDIFTFPSHWLFSLHHLTVKDKGTVVCSQFQGGAEFPLPPLGALCQPSCSLEPFTTHSSLVFPWLGLSHVFSGVFEFLSLTLGISGDAACWKCLLCFLQAHRWKCWWPLTTHCA